MLLRRSLLVALLLGLVAPVAARATSDNAAQCTDSTSEVHDIGLDHGFGATGRYALPAKGPNGEGPAGMVVFFHGYGHTADDWADHNLGRIAEKDRVIAIAMNYPGTDSTHTWQVQEGAQASNAAATWFDEKCAPPVVVAYGVSMGGNASGLALAANPKDAAGEPLYDWWFDIEGADNVIETYNEARALAPANAFAAEAQKGIELEMGGSFESVPDVYRAHTNVARADDIVASGIKGVVMVHAIDDGLVPYDQQREMKQAIGDRVGVQFWTVGSAGRVDGQNGADRKRDTTIDGYVTSNIPGAPAPLAGHSNENNEDSRVSWVGFDRLDELFLHGVEPSSSGDYLYDEDSSQYTKP